MTEPGTSFQFLRRTYELTDTGLKIMPGKYAETMIETYEGTMGKVKTQKLPCTQETLEADGAMSWTRRWQASTDRLWVVA